ncbi:hypothetical protein K491DRAFT_699513 [Lophiostoma macrostomum CBS 122681]|uniref:ATP synthase F(0) complex subunit e, mitochondrial n=1 Tax=Lophiostoma macrostomum CBS 122681 TaxID=1314788 RepID=A0A6A6SIM3_9PLEO|nr:hypothetical protein K491DRAFT_699513 [Lophiostoma macrostomum CBS 122681]
MASTGVNVLRWSALGVGVFYGFYHNQALKSQAQAHAAKAEWDHKESLISQAKAEWAKDHPQEQPKPSSGAKADPKDPNADYLAVLGIEDK